MNDIIYTNINIVHYNDTYAIIKAWWIWAKGMLPKILKKCLYYV